MEANVYSLRTGRIALFSQSSFLVKLGYKIMSVLFIFAIWHLAANYYNNSLLLPRPGAVMEKFFIAIRDRHTLVNLGITMGRVLKGFCYAFAIGVPLGFFMGYIKPIEELLGNLIDSLRQVPIMAWVPLTIVWFGIGDGPTIFLIAFGGVFPIVLNTIHGVKSVPKNYYNAAKSMGAGEVNMFFNITLPSAFPDILTGSRLAISTGWMSVI